jgi:hypothetical protein
MSNNEKKSILEVFGEKSKDADELVSSTLQPIANMPRGGSGEDILYKILTKGDELRYIHQYLQGYPTKDRRAFGGNMLRSDIASNPSFADTLSKDEGMKRLSPQEGVLSKLAKLLGL